MFDSSRIHILLVESESVLAELTSFRLELLGYQIKSVATGSEAMEIIRNEPPNLVIANTSLTDGDGLEWLSRLRGEISAEKLPVLALSLDPSLETVERAYYAGAQDYLITPFDPVILEQKIVDIVSPQLTFNQQAKPRRRQQSKVGAGQ